MSDVGQARAVDVGEGASGVDSVRRRRTRHRRSVLRRWSRQYGKQAWIYAVAIVLSVIVTYYLTR